MAIASIRLLQRGTFAGTGYCNPTAIRTMPNASIVICPQQWSEFVPLPQWKSSAIQMCTPTSWKKSFSDDTCFQSLVFV